MENNHLSDTDSIIHDFENKKIHVSNMSIITYAVLAVIIGLGLGYYFSKNNPQIKNSSSLQASGNISKGSVYGSTDTKTFKDTASGILQSGGIDGEGQYHIVRPGGDSQNVYLTSSIIDLSKFVGKKIKVNGQTQASKKAGWLMDVGLVEVME